MTFEQFKTECIEACHVRQACREGYADLLHAETTPALLRVVKNYWDDVYRSKYADIVGENIERWFDGQEDDFHRADVFVNEPADHGIVFVNNYLDGELRVKGTAKAYVFGASSVFGVDRAEVYCHTEGSFVRVRDHAYAHVERGTVVAMGYSSIEINAGVEASCYDRTRVTLNGGRILSYGHRSIEAWLDGVVELRHPNINRGVTLHDSAKIEVHG